MMVNGPLEIYGVVIGVKLFDAMFNILASMGLLYVPLIVLFFQNTTVPFESEMQNGASTSIRRVGINLAIWFLTVLLFVSPIYPLNAKEITYKPNCSDGAKLSKFGDTGTTYDKTFGNLHYHDLRLPLMMTLVLNAASGITNAMIVSIPCKTDVQGIKNMIDTTRLTPELTNQTERFNDECFAAARTKFNNQKPKKSQYQSIMNEYGGRSDLSWMGSHVFQSLYYGNMYPQKPVKGFPFRQYPGPYGEFNSNQKGVETPKWGYPSCKVWWNDAQHGLKNQLAQLANKHHPDNPHLGHTSLIGKVKSWLTKVKQFTHIGSQMTAKDVIVHDMLHHKGENLGFGGDYTGWMTDSADNSIVKKTASTGAAVAGQALAQAESHVKRHDIKNEIPMLQAVMLSLGLAFGPLVIVMALIAEQGIRGIFTYYFLIGSLILMPVVEKTINYIEKSVYASQAIGLYSLHNHMAYNVFTHMYLLGPMIYLSLMSISGWQISGAVVGAMRGTGYSGAGGGYASGGLKGAITTAAKFIK